MRTRLFRARCRSSSNTCPIVRDMTRYQQHTIITIITMITTITIITILITIIVTSITIITMITTTIIITILITIIVTIITIITDITIIANGSAGKMSKRRSLRSWKRLYGLRTFKKLDGGSVELTIV